MFNNGCHYEGEDGRKHKHHAQQKPNSVGRFLFWRFLADDDLRVAQCVHEMDWLGLALVGDGEAVIRGRRYESALLGGDGDGLAIEERTERHGRAVGHRRDGEERVEGVCLHSEEFRAAFRDAADLPLGAAGALTGTQGHRQQE